MMAATVGASGSSLVLPGDAVTVLAGIPDEWCQCVVTSPPYWGLRDYGTAQWEGGEVGCDHAQAVSLRRDSPGGFHNSVSRGTQPSTAAVAKQFADTCGKCGARRIDQQLGLESTPEEYVRKMVEGFREVRRVLRKDGTLWLNLGDSYNAAGREGHGTRIGYKQGTNRASASGDDWNRPSADRLKPKDLVGIPWRVAFALQADGWYLRSDIIWHKTNPMPESVTDRPTRSHEYLFLLTKGQRYYYNAEAVKEQTKHGGLHRCGPTGRNRRSVWTIPTRPFRGAHFATFPPKLIEPCILAGSRPGDVVLDPFCGSGTVGAVCCPLGRDFIGIDLNPDYCRMAEDRIQRSLDLVVTP